MIEHLDILTGYRTAPHIDVLETIERAATLLIHCLRNKIRPYKAFVLVPIMYFYFLQCSLMFNFQFAWRTNQHGVGTRHIIVQGKLSSINCITLNCVVVLFRFELIQHWIKIPILVITINCMNFVMKPSTQSTWNRSKFERSKQMSTLTCDRK